MKHDALQNKW